MKWMKYAQIALGLMALSLPVARGDTPRLIGLNNAGAEFGNTTMPGTLGTNYWYPRAADADYAKSQGAELVRIPFRWERILRAPNGVFDANFWPADIALLDAAIDHYEQRGIKVILDLHNFGAARLTIGGVTGVYMVGSPQVPVSELARVWRMLADRYKDRTNIWGYDIMNEPGQSIANWVPICQAVVDEIRLVDTKHAIILEGSGASKASQWTTVGAPLLAVTDPANNLVYSAHCYPDYDASGRWLYGTTVTAELVRADRYPTLAAALDVGKDRIATFVDWCVTNNVRGLVGEYGVPHTTDAANWQIVLDRMLDYMETNGNGLISGTQWAYGVADHPAISQRRDNSVVPHIAAVWPSYVSGAGTNYWPAFRIYDESITVTADYTFPYTFASPAPAAATITLDIADASSPFSGTKATKISYSVPAGGYAGGGFHIRGPLAAGQVGGVDISRSTAIAGHVLSLYAKGLGGNISVTLGSTSDASGVDTNADTATGNWISLGGITPLTNSWQRYEIPLNSIVTPALAAKNRIQRFRFTVAGAADVYLDKIMIEAPLANTAPVVTINTSTGGSAFYTGQTITFNATATDANPGDSIDYVEFYANTTKIGVDAAAPYQLVTSFAAAGTYDVKAIAFDSHGVVGFSSNKTITVTAGTPLSFQSVAADDGHVFETTETSNVGGTISTVTSTLYVGDDAANCQVKSIVSFDTSAIPDGATIVAATLKLRRASVIGTSPFTTHGAANVSIRNGGYSGNANLVAGDFQAVDSATNVGVLSTPAADGDWSEAVLSPAGLVQVNKTGKTQLRIAFALDDDNDATADAVLFSSGNEATAAYRPVLEVVYQ